jgi:hypothetical protein
LRFTVSCTRIDAPGGNGFQKAQVFEARICQNRPLVGLHEKPRREAEDQVAMGHAAREERVSLRRGLVHVGVERVAGEGREMLDIVQRHLARVGRVRVADAQVLEAAGERMPCASGRAAPVCHWPVIALSMSGLPCRAVRCM